MVDSAPAGDGFWSRLKLQRNDSSKVFCFYNWTYLEMKHDALAEHSLCTVLAQEKNLAGDKFCYKSTYVVALCASSSNQNDQR